MWPPLSKAIGHPELLTDPRFAETAERRKHSADLAAIMSQAFASNTYAYWLKALSASGITFGVISRPQDVPHDEQAVACGAVVETAIPDLPRSLSNPIRLGFAAQRTARPAPKLGQHSEEILREVGLEAREIAALKATGAVK